MNLKSIGLRWVFVCSLVLLCLLQAGLLEALEPKESFLESPTNMNLNKNNSTSNSEKLENFLNELETESNLLIEDSKQLSNQVNELQTEVNVLRFSFNELLNLYEKTTINLIDREARITSLTNELKRVKGLKNGFIVSSGILVVLLVLSFYR